MSIKEMPLEEKYDRIYDNYLLDNIVTYALHKELGVVDKCFDMSVEAQKKTLPKILDPVFKLLKVISPGRAFKQVINQSAYTFQVEEIYSNIELSWVSDREAFMRIKNCERLRRMRELVKRTGLDVELKELCDIEYKTLNEIGKE